MSNREKKEMIIWIDTGADQSNISANDATNEFNYYIGDVPYRNEPIKVELLKAYIAYNYTVSGVYSKFIPYNTSMIKIYMDFSTGSNYRYNCNGILMGVIIPKYYNINFLANDTLDNYFTPEKFGEELTSDPIVYTLHEKPNSMIGVKIYKAKDVPLLDHENGTPQRILLCLKYTY